jgi:hypothetical protein
MLRLACYYLLLFVQDISHTEVLHKIPSVSSPLALPQPHQETPVRSLDSALNADRNHAP